MVLGFIEDSIIESAPISLFMVMLIQLLVSGGQILIGIENQVTVWLINAIVLLGGPALILFAFDEDIKTGIVGIIIYLGTTFVLLSFSGVHLLPQ